MKRATGGYFSIFILSFFHYHFTYCQPCNPNFGFDNGNLANWRCFSGSVDSLGEISLSATEPIFRRHSIISSDSAGLDFFGNFPITSPNGSKYCIRLGDTLIGSGAERVSYSFVVPSNRPSYNFIINYAVVFQNPDHQHFEQPRFTCKIFDVSGSSYIECGSFNFVASSGLPGFQLSGKRAPGPDSAYNVFYKPWSFVPVKLIGLQGREIRLELTSNDCTRGGHFGYAYIDLVDNCDAEEIIRENVHCSTGQSLINLSGPTGFANYIWYPSDFSTVLGTNRTLVLQQLPPTGTSFALEVNPYSGLGCRDTLFTTIRYSDAPFSFKVISPLNECMPKGVEIQHGIHSQNTHGLAYNYYSDADELNSLSPETIIVESGEYYIRARNSDGCTELLPVSVHIWPTPVFDIIDPSPVAYPATIDLTMTVSDQGLAYSYWHDHEALREIAQPKAIDQTGTYYIKATSTYGCSAIKPVNVKIKALFAMPTAFTPNGDGKNDKYQLVARGGVRELSYFMIFNRWGQLVFKTRDIGEGWDGKVAGKVQDTGVYLWMVKAKDFLGNVFEEFGTILLIR